MSAFDAVGEKAAVRLSTPKRSNRFLAEHEL